MLNRDRKAESQGRNHHAAGWAKIVEVIVQYTIVIERAPENYAAYVPDMLGCIATADTREGVVREIRQALQSHMQCLGEYGEPVPEPSSTADVVEVDPVPA